MGRIFAVVLLGVLFHAGSAQAQADEESMYLGAEMVPPNILFLVDLSMDMRSPCPLAPGHSGGSPHPCLREVQNAISRISQHFEWANYGLAGTAQNLGTNTYFPIVPLGVDSMEFDTRMFSVLGWPTTTTRNPAEAISRLANDYFSSTTPDDGIDDDLDGFIEDWDESPIDYWCQQNHIIYITTQGPWWDDTPASGYTDSFTDEVMCSHSSPLSTDSTETECYYDNVARELYRADLRSDLDEDQKVLVHTIVIGLDPDSAAGSVPDQLYQSASDETDGEGVYIISPSSDTILGSIVTVMSDIRAGTYSRSTPIVSSEGDYLIYSFFEIEGGSPLGQGHLRAYEIDNDPTSENYGQVNMLSGAPYDGFGGAVWDGGDLLVSRLVTASESNPDDRDGFGRRDIYTFVDEMMGTSLALEGTSTHRMGFDYEFSQALISDPSTLNLFLDNTSSSPPCADNSEYDLDEDCRVDHDDIQTLIDFTRGLPTSTFEFMSLERGRWKLGDSPHSTPLVVSARNNTYALDPSYRLFLENLQAFNIPDMVFIAANDGMLHAFYLEDDPFTAGSEEGEEAWAWIPGYLLYREHGSDWSGRLVDQMLFGRTFLFDGSPTVEDVWIDNDPSSDDCSDGSGFGCIDSDGSEWRRVLVVQQGQGGPVTLALDITNTETPIYLWEQIDEQDPLAQGYSTSQPVIVKLNDPDVGGAQPFRWVAIWGSGHASIATGASPDYFQSTEANLYIWAIADEYFGSTHVGFNASGSTWINGSGYVMDEGGSNGHPEHSAGLGTLDLDGDSRYEYAYISANLTVVDADSDFDADTVYFPVTTTYGAISSGDSPSTSRVPGDSWMWKGLVNLDDVEKILWCDEPFFDPMDHVSERPEVYYAATTSWFADGSLGVYWGTGTPYDRTSDRPGYFFAVRDETPKACAPARPIDCDGNWGVYYLQAGEGLTAEPIVYAGVVYFSTYVNPEDQCLLGEGRIYGIAYDDCSPSLEDKDGDGVADAYDTTEGYPSKPTVTEYGTIFVGTSNPDVDGGASPVKTIFSQTNPFLGTTSLSWLEMY